MHFFPQEYFSQKISTRDISQDSKCIFEEANTKLRTSKTSAKKIYLEKNPYSLTLIYEFYKVHNEINLPPSSFSYNFSRFQFLAAATSVKLAKMTGIKTLAKVTDINNLAKMTDVKSKLFVIIC